MKVVDFLSHIIERPGCWGWTGAISSSGYARYGSQYAHRIAYELLVGPIPPGHEIDHVRKAGCTERTCTNPRHLEAVTKKENRRRQPNVIEQMERTHCPSGHPYEGHNLILRRGKRECRICTYERNKRNRAKKKAR